VARNKSGNGDAVACAREHTFGGQAVIEGVMMRGRHSWGVAVRRPSGGIARVGYPLAPPGSRHRVLRLPIVRGVVALYESLSLGIKALGISANIGLEDSAAASARADRGPDPAPTGSGAATAIRAPMATPATIGAASAGAAPAIETPALSSNAGPASPTPDLTTSVVPDLDQGGLGAAASKEPPQFGWKELAVTVLVAVAMAVVLFVVIPLVVVKHFESTFANPFLFNLVEGLIRIAIFILYIVGISLIPDLRRVFQYHGAEHKVIHAFEACGKPDAEHARGYSTLHPRCGTGFLLLVMVIAVFLFAVVGKPGLPLLVLSRIIGIPVIVGISYEIGIKWAGKHPDGFFARILLWPGLQLQRLTTREPTPDQIEVAAAALDEVMRLDESEQSAPGEMLAQA
jgi:uncharacterized protein YqhQ